MKEYTRYFVKRDNPSFSHYIDANSLEEAIQNVQLAYMNCGDVTLIEETHKIVSSVPHTIKTDF